MKRISIILSTIILLVITNIVFAQEENQEGKTYTLDVEKMAYYDEAGNIVPVEDLPFEDKFISDNTFDGPAPESLEDPEVGTEAEYYKEGDQVSCFDYLRPGNIELNVSKDYIKYNSGDPVVVKGYILNKNKFPLIHTDIKGVLIKDGYIFDEFVLQKDLTLSADSKKEILTYYVLPKNLPTGSYKISFLVLDSGMFNVSGFSVDEQIYSANLSFDVLGSDEKFIYNDKNYINQVNTSEKKPIPEIFFTTTKQFSIQKGIQNGVVTCFFDRNFSGGLSTYKVETKVIDEKGKIIAKSLYDGVITDSMDAISQKIKINKNIFDYRIEATIYDSNNNVIHKVERVYSCKDIDPESCPTDTENNIVVTLITVLGSLGVLIAVLYVFKLKKINIEKI